MPYRCPPHSEYARLMRSWPGLETPEGVDDHVIRRTRRDYETFGLMKPGDRYPQAMAIATDRVRNKFCQHLGNARTEDENGVLSRLLDEFERAHVPPACRSRNGRRNW